MDKSLLCGEKKHIEYKRSYSKTFLKTVSAYANYHNGWILFGVKDDGGIVGVADPESLKLSIEHGINDAIDPVPYYEIETYQHQDKLIVAVHVFKGDHTPYTCSGKTYIRRDTSVAQVDRIGLTELILVGRNSGFDEIEYADKNLSFALLESRLKRIRGKESDVWKSLKIEVLML